MHWIENGDGYALALEGAPCLCRNTKGKVPASVPKAVRESARGEQLLQLRDWMVVNARECLATVERWMLRSLPVPRWDCIEGASLSAPADPG